MGWRASTARWRWSALAAFAAGAALGAGGSAGLAAAPSFEPESATFVSLRQGWALGTISCASGRCLALRETVDAGRAWSAPTLPPALLAAADRRYRNLEAPLATLNVRFADPHDGWIYGGVPFSLRQSGLTHYGLRPVLWSTHDGGARWSRQLASELPHEDSIYDLEAAGGTAYLMRANAQAQVAIERTPVAGDDWTVVRTPPLRGPAGGAQPSGGLVLQGGGGWLVEGNDRGTDGSARLVAGRWVAWTPPCAAVGGSFAIPAAASASDLAAVCVMGGFAAGLSPSAPAGAKLGSSWLYSSNDAGLSFRAGPEIARQDAGDPAALGGPLASPQPQTLVLGRDEPPNGHAQMIASFDGGLHWTVEAAGEPTFIGFTSPSQGVAIIAAHGATSLLMTFDGGHHWAPVAFQLHAEAR